jgi:hypothetical protein
MPAASLNRNFSARPVCRAWVAALGGCLIAASIVQAQQPFVEAEPNNRPETATGFRAPANLMGDMPGGDQDADGGGEATTNTDAYRLIFRSEERVPASSGACRAGDRRRILWNDLDSHAGRRVHRDLQQIEGPGLGSSHTVRSKLVTYTGLRVKPTMTPGSGAWKKPSPIASLE